MNGALGCAVVTKQDILITSGTRSDEKEKGKKGNVITMDVQAQDSTAEPILKYLTTAFAPHTTIEQT